MNVGRIALIVAVVAATATSCGGDDDTTSSSRPTTETPASTPATTTATVTETVAGPTTEPAPSAAAQLLGADTWLACQCPPGSVDQIQLFRVDGADERMIFEDITGFVRHPDFSRDGQRLAFDRLEADEPGVPDELWVADADGSKPERLDLPCIFEECLGVWQPAWSPDGEQLAAIAFVGPATDAGPSSFAVVIVDLASNEMRVVYEQPVGEGQLHFPRWSPDGTQLTFWNEGDTPTTWIVGTDGSGLRQMTPPELEAGDPDWSPDGSQLVVSSRPLSMPTGPSDLYTVAVADGTTTKLTDSVGDEARFTQPRWTPDGDAIVYTRETRAGRKVWIRSLDGSVEGPLGSTQRIQTHPVVRPTG